LISAKYAVTFVHPVSCIGTFSVIVLHHINPIAVQIISLSELHHWCIHFITWLLHQVLGLFNATAVVL